MQHKDIIETETPESLETEGTETETVEAAAGAEEIAAAAHAGLAALEAEIAELKDRLLRAVAETENVRRRAEKERQDAAVYGVTNFARDMLTVADNLRRVLDALPEDLLADEKVKGFAEGCQMTERELLNTLERHGIRKMSPEKGARFDPNHHQAMFEVEDPALAPGSIVTVMQAGFTIKDRLLRPALVGVSKGGAAHVDTSA